MLISNLHSSTVAVVVGLANQNGCEGPCLPLVAPSNHILSG